MTKKTDKKVAKVNNKPGKNAAPVVLCNPDPADVGTPEVPALPPAIVGFMIAALGGLDSVRKAWAVNRVRSLGSLPFGDIQAAAVSEGWADILATMTPADLSGPAARKTSPSNGKPRGRAAVAGAAENRDKVVAFLRSNPAASARAVSEGTGLDRDAASNALGALVKAGTVKRDGNRHSSVYSVA